MDNQGDGYVYISLNTAHDWVDITEGLSDDWIVGRDGLNFADPYIDPSHVDYLSLGSTKGLCYLNTNVYSGTVSSGPVDWNDDWIFMPGDYTVGTNATLNVAAGTQVYTARGSDSEGSGVDADKVELIVNGDLNVNGTSGSPVEFLPAPADTAAGPHLWRGIRLRPDSDGDFDYANVQQCYRGIEADSCDTLDIDHCTFHRHQDSGVSLREPPSGTSVSHCAFDSCDYGVKIEGDSATVYENYFSDCDYGIYYSGTGNPVFRENTIDFSAGTFTCGIYTTDSTGANSPLIDCCQIFGPCPYGIDVLGGSPTIYSNEIIDCRYGIHYIGGDSPVIRRNTIRVESISLQDSCYYGIYTKETLGTNSPHIDSCKVSGYSLYGIYMEKAGSNGYVKAVTCSSNANGIRLQTASPSMICQAGGFNSIIYNDSLGLVMAGSSSPDMRYNKIKHNEKRGVHVGGTSSPDLDPLDPGEGDGGRNSICYFDDGDPNITTRPGWYYDLHNGTQNTIDAEGNYWGDPTDYWNGDNPYVHTSENVDYDPMLHWRVTVAVGELGLRARYHSRTILDRTTRTRSTLSLGSPIP